MKKFLALILAMTLIASCSDDDNDVGPPAEIDLGGDTGIDMADMADTSGEDEPDVPSAPGELEVDPATLTFSDVRQGETETQTVTVSNVGGSPILVTNLQVTEVNRMGDPEFEQGSKWFEGTVTIEPQTFAQFEVVYAPNDTEVDTGRISFNTTDPNLEEVVIPIDVINSYPDIEAPEFVRFGTVAPGETSVQRIRVLNRGIDALTVESVSLSDPNGVFTLSYPFNMPPVALNRDDDWALDVEFAPTNTMTRRGTVTITSNDPDQPDFDVALTGNDPTPCLSLSQRSVDFEKVAPGASVSQEIVLLNCSGSEPLTVSAIEIPDDSGGTFSLTGLPMLPLELLPRETAAFEVRANPGAPGEYIGELTIESTDESQGSKIVELRITAAEEE